MRRGQEQDTHKQAVSCKSALPYYYCAQMANSSQQPDQGQTLAHFRDRFKSRRLQLDST